MTPGALPRVAEIAEGKKVVVKSSEGVHVFVEEIP